MRVCGRRASPGDCAYAPKIGWERGDCALLVVDGEQGVTQGRQRKSPALRRNPATPCYRHQTNGISRVDAERDAASRDADTAQRQNRSALPAERPQTGKLRRGTVAFDYEKMISARIEIPELSANCVYLRENRRERQTTLFPLINPCWEGAPPRIGRPV